MSVQMEMSVHFKSECVPPDLLILFLQHRRSVAFSSVFPTTLRSASLRGPGLLPRTEPGTSPGPVCPSGGNGAIRSRSPASCLNNSDVQVSVRGSDIDIAARRADETSATGPTCSRRRRAALCVRSHGSIRLSCVICATSVALWSRWGLGPFRPKAGLGSLSGTRPDPITCRRPRRPRESLCGFRRTGGEWGKQAGLGSFGTPFREKPFSLSLTLGTSPVAVEQVRPSARALDGSLDNNNVESLTSVQCLYAAGRTRRLRNLNTVSAP